MPTFYDSNKTPYILTQEIGRGGEGTVFHCPNDPSLVAKIYHEAITEEKAEKLLWMAANKNDQLLKIAAWMVDVLYDKPDGRIVGFLMPNVKAKEIHELYSLKSRRIHFPDATWEYLVHTAANVARAFYVLHKNDHIMGDVNHGNLVVLADGRVNLIDCDSYSIQTDKMRYRCDVGVATHLAPELQGIDLSEIEREMNHDNFGLAVIIFQLLFLGRHPFAGNYLGAEDKSIEDCIRELRFAYANQKVTNVKQPPGTLSLSQIPPRLSMMFMAAFMTKNRPEPREWIEALEDLSKSLQQCPAHIGHHFFEELIACPWCEIEAKTGLMLFPFVSSDKNPDEKGFNIFTVENLLASFNTQQNLPAKPVKTSILPPPSPDAIEVKRDFWTKAFGFAFLYFIISVFLISMFGFVDSFVWNLIALGGFLYNLYNFHQTDKKRLEGDVHDANRNWEKLENEWTENKDSLQFDQEVQQIRQKLTRYQNLQKERHEHFQNLDERTYQYYLSLYLSTFEVAKVSGIEQKYRDALSRYGLQTAADFNASRLNSLLAIDHRTKDILFDWREGLEEAFALDPNAELPVEVKNQVESQFTEKRRKVEKDIENLLASLRAGALKIQLHQRQLLARAEGLSKNLLQAQSNQSVLGSYAPIPFIFIGIAFFVPGLIAAIVPSRGSSPPPVTKSREVVVSNSNSTIRDVSYSISNVSPEAESDYQVKEKFTAERIANMSLTEREKAAKALYSQALPLMAEDANETSLKKAEEKLLSAVKLVDYDTKILYSLASVYYKQKRHNESNEILEKSLKINDNNLETKLLIGANYLRLARYHEAELHFSALKSDYPTSFEVSFNLGLTCKYLGNNKQSEFHFLQATLLKPNDIDAHYEYGLILYQNGKTEEAWTEYQKLLDLDAASKAEKLRNGFSTRTTDQQQQPKYPARSK